MKYYLILFLFFICRTSFAQQNLIPNPSFEDTVRCPSNASQLYNASGWVSFGGTPDYWNACWTLNTSVGTRIPHSGNAFAGAIFIDIYPNTNREILGTRLEDSLIIGTKYYISMFLNRGQFFPNISLASNKQSIAFSTVPYDSVHRPMISLAAVENQTIIEDTVSWTQIKGEFVADSNYKYIIIGNFGSISTTDTIHLNPSTAQGWNIYDYYFIDDICVSTDSNVCYNNSTSVNTIENSSISLYPNPNNGTFQIQGIDKVDRLDIYNILGQKEEYVRINDIISISPHSKSKIIILVFYLKNGSQKTMKLLTF